MEYPVHLFVENEKKDGYKFVASGSLALDKTEIAFKSTMTERPKKVDTEYKIGDMELVFDKDCETEPVEDEFMTISMPVKNLVTVANIPGTSVDLYDEKHTYRMIFARELGATKYALAIEEMARLRGERQ